ncbi:MAG TPA: SDR family NAD(P)-dependent oxidoreductase [Umezawaea sp.]|nr:SDR family NAD(P)-dependent oxidoreductase [Umezawaea sp.]
MTTPTRITTPFTRDNTAADVVEGIDLTGRRIVVTGAASGIGVETARALAAAGAEVTLAVRDVDAGHRTAADITESTGSTALAVAHLDLSDLDSVAAFAQAWTGPLHVLINNAGVMATPETRTSRGWELQFATNHLGHFALALGLHDALAEADDARVVSLSSSAHLRSPVVFDDLHFRERPYDPWQAYGQSKTANILFAVEGTRRWAADGIAINAVMPGGIRTGLQRHQTKEQMDALLASATANGTAITWKNTEQGASTSVLLATSPLLKGIGGHYFEDNNEALPNVPPARNGVAAYALDPDAAATLWEISADLVAR